MDPKTVNVDMLNDDCLVEIFSCLNDSHDLFNLEQVCERWKSLAPRVWPRTPTVIIQNVEDMNHLESVIRCCRKNISRLEAYYEFHFPCQQCSRMDSCSSCDRQSQLRDFFTVFFNYVKDKSKTLEHLSLYGFWGWPEELNLLSNISASCLNYIYFGELPNMDDDLLENILMNAPLLENLIIHEGANDFNGESLLKLSSKCKNLELCWCFLHPGIMTNVFKRLPNLERLVLVGSNVRLDMLRHQSNLVHLDASFSNFHMEDPDNGLDFDLIQLNMKPFHKLKSLNVEGNVYLNESKLLAFNYLYPNLESLNLSDISIGPGTREMDEHLDEEEAAFDLGPLANFPYLKVLKLNGNQSKIDFENSACGILSELEVLECLGYTDLSYAGLIRMIGLCPKLKTVRMNCSSVEDVFNEVDELRQILNSRSQLNIFLEINTRNENQIDDVKKLLKERHPSLHLYNRNKNRRFFSKEPFCRFTYIK